MKFALITEGISEKNIIKHIISKYFKEQDPIINPIQPKVVNEKQETTGGWNEVLKYCKRDEDLTAIFIENEYLVIQIDSDQSQQSPFNVSHTKHDNSLKSVAELHTDIKNKLKEIINPAILDKYQHRIIFAISVHTIECWLLPIYYINNHKSSTTSCIEKLNIEITKKNINPIPSNSKNNPHAIRSYTAILKNWKRKEEIIAASRNNAGFKKFVESMDEISIN